jgi:hypothetical protein
MPASPSSRSPATASRREHGTPALAKLVELPILLGRLVLRVTTGSEGRYTGESRARLGVGLGWAGTQVHTLLLYLIGAASELVAGVG